MERKQNLQDLVTGGYKELRDDNSHVLVLSDRIHGGWGMK